MRHGLRILALLLAVGLVVLAAGCGGSKNTAPTTTLESTTTGNSGPTGGGPTGNSGPTGSGGFASAKNCLAFASLASRIASAMTPTSGGSSIENGARTLQAIADAAPSDIKGDLQTIASAFGSYIQKLKDSGFDPNSQSQPTQAQMAAIVQAAQEFDTPQFKAASQHLSQWERQNCK